MMNVIRPVALLLVLITFATAQTTPRGNQKTKKTGNDLELQQRRATAMSLLQSLAIEARSYSDEPLRARVQAQIADVMWNQDKEAARTLFRRAWEIAEVVDQTAASSNLPGRLANNGSRTQPRANVRREILNLASRRDHALGEEFLAKLTPRDDADPKSAARELSATETA